MITIEDTIFLTNVSGSELIIRDLAKFTLDVDEEREISHRFTPYNIMSSYKLKEAIEDGQVTVKSGTTPLTTPEAIKLLFRLPDTSSNGVDPSKWLVSANDGNIIVDYLGSIMEVT